LSCSQHGLDAETGQGRTECYDCNVKETPKSFPVCTIRSTPSQLIHCIVWAKSYLFTEIFGTSEDEAPEMDHSKDAENAEEIENLHRESRALKKIRESMDSQEFPRMVFTKVFEEDIERLRSMEDMWKSRKPPEALHYDNLSQHTPEIGSVISSQDRRIWSMTENFAVFTNSLKRLSERMAQTRAGRSKEETSPPVFTFDKDDQDILDFVVASANLRSLVFGIETKSKFDIKRKRFACYAIYCFANDS
jgi:ubiquitin-like 1-activating enzyme E1 B